MLLCCRRFAECRVGDCPAYHCRAYHAESLLRLLLLLLLLMLLLLVHGGRWPKRADMISMVAEKSRYDKHGG